MGTDHGPMGHKRSKELLEQYVTQQGIEVSGADAERTPCRLPHFRSPSSPMPQLRAWPCEEAWRSKALRARAVVLRRSVSHRQSRGVML